MAGTIATGGLMTLPASRPVGYGLRADANALDTLKVRLVGQDAGVSRTSSVLGSVVPGYLSRRGLPPIQGRFTLSDSGLVFWSADGAMARFPLVGLVREAGGRERRASTVALAYIDESGGRPAYVFRVDAGVFETDMPGALLDLASHPGWLDSITATEWKLEQPLVPSGDSTAVWRTAHGIAAGTYADSLYALFGRPTAPVGLIGMRGRKAGRLGEYIASRDSLALDPARMVGMPQLRHTLAHELAHRWQARAPGQVATLWQKVVPIRDPKRYGYGNASEHQAEAIAFAIDFLQTTAAAREPATRSIRLLDHYELLVPGTRILVRYLALQPIYRAHPLAGLLTTGGGSEQSIH